jgi:hypothetical protein
MIGYVTEAELSAYAVARGITLNLATSITLTRALDYIESRSYKGEKTDPLQTLQFPRDGDTTVPDDVKNAQMVAAIIYDGGDDPMGAIGPRVLSNTVVGAVAQTYSDKGNQATLYPHLSALLRPYLLSSGTQFVVSR